MVVVHITELVIVPLIVLRLITLRLMRMEMFLPPQRCYTTTNDGMEASHLTFIVEQKNKHRGGTIHNIYIENWNIYLDIPNC